MSTKYASWLLLLVGCGDDGGGGSGSVAATEKLMVRVDNVSGDGRSIGLYGSTSADHVELSGMAWRFYANSVLAWENLSTGTSGGPHWLYAETPSTDLTPGTISWRMIVPLTPGTNRIIVRAYDPYDRYLPDQSNLEIRRTLAVQVTDPVSVPIWWDTYRVFSAGSTLGIQGTASPGDVVTHVTWRNETTGQEGIASGTETWMAEIALLAGTNRIVVTAHSPLTSGNVRIEVVH